MNESWKDDDTPPDSALTRDIKLSYQKPLDIYAMKIDPADRILANGYLEKGAPCAFCGVAGLGKSRLILQCAIYTALGLPFLGWPTTCGPLRWLILQTENGNRRLQTDLCAMLAEFAKPQIDVINESILIHTLENDDDGMLFLSNPHVVAALTRDISAFNADIVVYDPLRDFAAGELNSDADMAATLAIIGRITRAGNQKRVPLIVHHALTGKAGISKALGFERTAFGRNSKVLLGWVRSQINLAPYDPDNNDTLVVASGKCNNAQEFEPFGIRLDSERLSYFKDPDVDVKDWKERIASSNGETDAKVTVTIALVVKIVEAAGLDGIAKKAIVRAIRDETGCTSKYPYEVIEKATAKNAIVRRSYDDLYVVPKSPPKN
jgi:hypothetical protein